MQPTEILTLSPVLAYRVSRRLACTVKQFYSCKNPTAFTPFRPGQIAIIVMDRTQVLIKYLESTALEWKHYPEGRKPRPMFLGIRCDALGAALPDALPYYFPHGLREVFYTNAERDALQTAISNSFNPDIAVITQALAFAQNTAPRGIQQQQPQQQPQQQQQQPQQQPQQQHQQVVRRRRRWHCEGAPTFKPRTRACTSATKSACCHLAPHLI